MKKIAGIIIVLTLFINIFSVVCAEDDSIEVYVDGTKIQFVPPAFTDDHNVVFAQLDTLCSAIGATLKKSMNGSNEVYTISKTKTNREIRLENNKTTVLVNGKSVDIENDPVMIGENEALGQKRAFVPIKLVVERLGGEAVISKGKVIVNSYKPIKFISKNLENAVRSQFEIPEGEIYLGDVNSEKTFIARGKTIVDIEGLQYFENLNVLDISDNQVKDFSPLRELKNISMLMISGNPSTDYSPVAPYYSKLKEKDFNINVKFNDKKIEEAAAAAVKKKAGGLTLDDLLSIKELDLSDRGISDLSGIEFIANLTSLDLSENNLKNIEPLKNLADLQNLLLYCNDIENTAPLGYLGKLEKLDLDENYISDLAPMKNCTRLKQLTVMGNDITRIDIIGSFTNLEILDLSENDIEVVNGVEKLASLKELYLNSNRISDVSLLGNLVNLEVLDVSENEISKINGLEKLKKLKALYLSSNKISELTLISSLTGLQLLDLAENSITKTDELAKLVELNTLYLSGNKISDYSPLKACTKLVDKDFGEPLPARNGIVQKFYIGKYTYTVNGEEKKMDTKPVIKNSRTFLPIRYVSETIGAKVDWNEADKRVTITHGTNNVVLYINQDAAKINGTLKKIDAPPFILEGRTMLPIRFVSENLGLTVNWDPDKQEVTLSGGSKP